MNVIQQHLTEEDGKPFRTIADSFFDDGVEQGMQQGMQQGQKQGDVSRQIETARRMISAGFSVDQIKDLTDLSIEQVQALLETVDV